MLRDAKIIGIVAAKELRQLARDRRAIVALFLFVLVEIVVCRQAFRETVELRAWREQQQQSARADWLSQATVNPHMATHHGTTLLKIPSPLSAFDSGVDPDLGASLHVEAHQQKEMARPAREEQVSLLKFEASTPALLLQLVFPLLLILLCHAGVSGERERGTLRLALSMGIDWNTWMCGKLLAGSVVVAVVSMPAVLLFACIVPLSDSFLQMEIFNLVSRLLVLWGTLLLYLTGWGALALGISSRVASSRHALLLLLLLWTGWTVILPRMALDFAQAQAPLPTAEEIRDRRQNIMNRSEGEAPELRQRLDALQQRLLKEYGVDRVRDLPVSFAGAKMIEIERYTDEKFDQIQADLHACFARQDQIVEWFASCSPYLAMRAVSMAFSGTDRRHHEDFLGAAEEYRRILVHTMNTADMQNRKIGDSPEERRAFWEQVPPFQYAFPESWRVAQVAAWPLVLLLIWSGATWIFALIPPSELERNVKSRGGVTGIHPLRRVVRMVQRFPFPLSSEWKLAMADPAFRFTMTALAVLTIIACLPGIHQANIRQERSQELAARNEMARLILESAFSEEADLAGLLEQSPGHFSLEEARNLRLAARSPDLLSHRDGLWWTWQPPALLAPLAVGESIAWPDRYRLTASSPAVTLDRGVLENPLHARIGPFDLTLFVAVVLPLGMIVLTHGLVSAEREQGVLALLASQPVSLWRLFFSRCLIRVGAAALVVIAVTFVVLSVNGRPPVQASAAFPFALWSVTVLLYALFWGMLAFVVNAGGGSSSTNAIALLFGWLLLVLIVPSAVARQVSKRHPVPPPTELVEREQVILAECRADSDRLVAGFLNHHQVDSGNPFSPQQQEMIRYLRVHEEAARRFESVLSEELQKYRSRDDAVNAWAWLSPVVAWRQLAVHCAGTGLSHAAAFAERTCLFQEESRAFFQPYSIAEQELSLEDVRRIPRFDPVPLPLEGAAPPSGRSRLSRLPMVLLAWSGIACLLAGLRFRAGIAMK